MEFTGDGEGVVAEDQVAGGGRRGQGLEPGSVLPTPGLAYSGGFLFSLQGPVREDWAGRGLLEGLWGHPWTFSVANQPTPDLEGLQLVPGARPDVAHTQPVMRQAELLKLVQASQRLRLKGSQLVSLQPQGVQASGQAGGQPGQLVAGQVEAAQGTQPAEGPGVHAGAGQAVIGQVELSQAGGGGQVVGTQSGHTVVGQHQGPQAAGQRLGHVV